MPATQVLSRYAVQTVLVILVSLDSGVGITAAPVSLP